MSGFSFPPPPPPPPRASQSQNEGSGHPSDSSNRGRGRGRGRGSSQRGRGEHRAQSSGRPPYHPGSAQSGSWPNGFTAAHVSSLPNGEPQNWQTTHLQAQLQNLPAGAFVNPNFVPNHGLREQRNLHNTNYSTEQRPHAQRDSNKQHGSPPRTFAGHKRKLEALRGSSQEKAPAPPVAPSVPSFGLPPMQSTIQLPPTLPSATLGTQSKQRSTSNLLGLTPANWDAQYSSSGSDDDDEHEIDEEALHAQLGDKLTFEHNGVVMSLSSQADLAAWKNERRKNWPTRARMAERDVQRRRVGEERKRLLAEARLLHLPSRRQTLKKKGPFASEPVNQIQLDDSFQRNARIEEPTDVQQRETKEKIDMEAAKDTSYLEVLRAKVMESEEKHCRAVANCELHSEAETTINNDGKAVEEPEASLLSKPSSGKVEDENSESGKSGSHKSSSGGSSDSSSSSEDDSDEGPPEETTSKPVEPTRNGLHTKVCRYFAASGYCRDGDGCRFRHERNAESMRGPRGPMGHAQPPPHHNAPPNRSRPELRIEKQSLYQRLLEQEMEQEDRLALKVIKYLGQSGFFKDSSTPRTERLDGL